MEIEGFKEIMSVVTLAKLLHDMGRSDVVIERFYDLLDYDGYYENMYRLIEEIFTGFISSYDENAEEERMIFTDAVISRYYVMAWEYGRKHRLLPENNPYITAAANEARRWLSFTYSMAYRLFGYTKSRAAAQRSKLVVYVCTCDYVELDYLAYGLLMLYKWFAERCAEFDSRTEAKAA